MIAIAAILLVAVPAFTQTPPALSGVVQDETGAALQAAEVAVIDTSNGRTTVHSDGQGRFEIPGLPPGRYLVEVRRPGFDMRRIEDVDVGDGNPVTLTIELRVPGFSEVVSVGGRQAAVATAPSVIAVSPLDVRSVAGAGENIYRVLQTLPGVSAVEDFDSRLTVRGGGPDQNLTIMDGVEIHNPYRLFGLTSAFNPETVRNFELTTGGFSAKYGDRLSSILVVENRAGSAGSALGATAAMGLTDGNLIAEGRLPGAASNAWLVTGRRTYYDLVAERIVDADLPSFADLQARADVELAPGRTLTFFGLGSRESTDAEFDGDSEDERLALQTSTSNDLGAVTFAASLGRAVFSRTTASWYRNRESIDFDGDFRIGAQRSNRPDEDAEPIANVVFTRALSIRDVAVRQEFTINAGPSHLIETGFETHDLDTDWSWRITGERNLNEANGSSAIGGWGLPSLLDSVRTSSRTGAWLTDRWTIVPWLRTEPGVRVDWSGLSGETTVSPRLAVVADITPRTKARVAGGLFTQSPGYEKLLQSDYFLDLSDAESLRLRSERAWHALASIERRVGAGTTARIEGYYKAFDRLVVGRLETPAEVAARTAAYDFPAELDFGIPRTPQITSVPGNDATGRAYGVEFYAARQATSADTRFTGWASYTWGRAETTAYGRTFLADYDRRHALSVVTAYRLSRLIEVATTVRAQSGFPYTPAIAVRPAAIEDAASDGTDVPRLVPRYDAQGALVWVADYGSVDNINSQRLPVFARVDMRITFRPGWSDHRWQFYVEVINLLDRDNASTLDTVLEYHPRSDRPALATRRGGSLPILPSFGIRYRF